jgi:hypothetical protein
MTLGVITLVDNILAKEERREPVNFALIPIKAKTIVGEPVILTVNIKNVKSKPLLVDLGTNRKEAYRFKILDIKGKTLALPPSLRVMGLSQLGKVLIRPGRTYEQKLILDEWYVFPKPGTYTVICKLYIGEDISVSAKCVVEKQKEDLGKLREICRTYFEIASTGTGIENRMFAATALSFCTTSSSIYYLLKLAQNDSLCEDIRVIAIHGLGRQATGDSAEALMLLFRNPELSESLKSEVLFQIKAIRKIHEQKKALTVEQKKILNITQEAVESIEKLGKKRERKD